MCDSDHKLKLIHNFVDSFNYDIKKYPASRGTIEQVQDAFRIIDYLDLVLRYGECDEELTWGNFVWYKGEFGELSPAQWLRAKYGDDPNVNLYKKLNELRDEYYRWRELKVDSIRDPENNGLLRLLSRIGKKQAVELIPWFIRHPSKKAELLYAKKIKREYVKNNSISLFLSGCGNKDIIEWAVCNINNDTTKDIVVRIIAASPDGDINNTIDDIIKNGNTEEIMEVMRGYYFSQNNDRVFQTIEFILDNPPQNLTHLYFDIVTALSGPARSADEKTAQLRKQLNFIIDGESPVPGGQ